MPSSIKFICGLLLATCFVLSATQPLEDVVVTSVLTLEEGDFHHFVDNGSGGESGSGSGSGGGSGDSPAVLPGQGFNTVDPNGSGSGSGSGDEDGDEDEDADEHESGSGSLPGVGFNTVEGSGESNSGSGEQPTPEAATTEAATTSIGLHTDYRKVGCFQDNVVERVMDMLAGSSEMMSPLLCSSMCDKVGTFLFFGLENVNDCWCGNDPFRLGTSSSCTLQCPTLSHDLNTCGGESSLDVYAYVNGEPVTETSSTSTAAPVAAFREYTGLVYEGCFHDSLDVRALADVRFVDYYAMTPEYCAEVCMASGWNVQYIGVQYTSECYCGNTPFLFGMANALTCNMPCAGDGGVACGGPFANSVYRIASVTTAAPITSALEQDSGSGSSGEIETTHASIPSSVEEPAVSNTQYMGCYADSTPKDFALGPFLSDSMSPLLCQALCSNYRFFGLQNGNECYCGQLPFMYGAAQTCNVPCKGDTAHTCGGESTNSIFGNCDENGCGFLSKLEPYGGVPSLQGSSSTTSSSGSGSSLSGWAIGAIGACVAVAAVAGVVVVATHFQRKKGKKFLAEQMEEDELFPDKVNPLFDGQSLASSAQFEQADADSHETTS
eukprot:m.74145 g.74145  ORF g.74145 m.74145 type:complete len:607 (-) comp13070_c2_seq1:69-1889(-)